MELKDKVVFITGASRGIGRETARIAQEEGARVFGISRSGGNGTFKADITDFSQCQKTVAAASKKFGTIDVLVNNAGVVSFADLADSKIEDVDNQINVNFKGLVYMTRAVLPIMKEKQHGVIVNVASGAGKTGFAGIAVYCGTKAAVLRFTEALAKELAADNIHVYAVSPGATKTEMTGFAGMDPAKVAKRIIDAAKENLGLSPGEDSEIYY